MANEAIATVVAVIGKAYARDADGQLRELKPGDVLLEGETVVTPEGGSVELALADGSPFVVAEVAEMTLTRDLIAERAAGADESAVEDETVEAVLAALEEGEGDILEDLEATAAGAGGAGGDGGGHSFVRLGRIVEETSEFHTVANLSTPEAGVAAEDDPLITVDAIDDAVTTEPGESVVIPVQVNDIFIEGSIVTAVTQPDNGSVVINPDGTVTYTPDDGFFGQDTFTYTATTPDGNAQDTATVTVTVPEPEPEPITISIDDVTVVEGETAELTVSLSAASDEPVTVQFGTLDDTATVTGADYDPETGTLTFAPGQTTATIQVQTNEDDLIEGSEQFFVNLSNASGAEIADGQGVVTIVDASLPTIAISDVTVTEGQTAELTLSLSEAVDTPVSVQFDTLDDTATVIGGDYDPETGTVTFAPGETTITIQVQTNEDDLEEPTEQFFVNLSNADGATIADDQGVVTIVDGTEPPPPPPPPPGNNPPEAVDDAFSTAVNTPVEGSVLPNDSDPDGDPLTVTGNTQPSSGSVVMNADGTFTYTPDETFDGTDSFDYTISDGEGGTSTATVTITIVDGEVTLDVPTAGEAGTQVLEAGLPARSGEPEGSNAGAASETTTGTITYTVEDAPETITVGGEVVTAEGQQIQGTHGVLTITSLAAGSIGYSYTLADNTSGDSTSDTFAVSVTDIDGDEATGDLVINIVDDVPEANLDSDSLGVGDFGPVEGNVLSNDVVGADDAQVVGVAVGDTGTSLDDTGTVGATINGQYGTLTIDAAGNYTYVRNEGTEGGVQDVFTYTIQDGDGDLANTTLTITIADGDVTVDVPAANEAGTEVSEAGLPARAGEPEGSDAAADSETTEGTITYTVEDSPATITIGGDEVTAVGQQIQGTHGVLTITSLAAGSVGYSYTLTDNTSGDATSDDFAVVVSDVDGDEATGTLSIDIVDDVPEANLDSDSLGSGDFGPATGNVLSNDVVGADDAQVVGVAMGDTGTSLDDTGTVGATITGQYGTLTIDAAGNYSYTRDPGTEGGVQDVFTYTIQDGDGDLANTTLTVTIEDGNVTVDIPTEGEAGTEVSEAGLPARAGEPEGSDAAADSETTEGTITYTVTDTPATITIGGEEVTAEGQQIQGTHGVLTITSLAAGSVGYSYTLTDNTSGDTTSDDFAVVVSDVDGDEATGTLSIDIVDDVPEAILDSDSLGSGDFGPATGNVLSNDVVGADDAQVVGVAMGDTGTSLDDTGTVGATINGQYGTLTIDAAGNYSYTRNPGTEGGVQDVFTYTIQDGDGDLANTTLTVTIEDGDVTVDVPAANEAGTEVSEAGLPARAGEPEGSDAAADSETTEGTITYTVTDMPATITIGGEEVTAEGQQIQGTHGVLTITSLAAGSVGYSYTLTDNTSGDTTSDDFAVVVSDVDGDEATGTLSIDIVDDVPTANPDTAVVAEGGSVSGNVIDDADAASDDVLGADGASIVGVAAGSDTSSPVSGGINTTIEGTYGDLILQADGGYIYTADPNTVPPGAEDVFVYTLEDGDGDTSTTTLTITHADSGLSATPADISVDEAALAVGSNPDSDAEIATGTLSVSGGTGPYTFAVVDSGTGSNGTLVVDPNTGEYTYTLENPFVHTPGVDDGVTTADNVESFQVEVTDANGNTTTTTVTVDIVDDVPMAFSPGTVSVVDGSNETTDPVALGFASVAGADGADAVVFDGFEDGDPALDSGGNQLKLDGEDLLLYGAGTDQLEVRTASGTVGLQIDIDGDNYTVTPVNGVITNGQNLNDANLTSVGGGNVDQKVLLDPFGEVSGLDVILTGAGNSGDNTVNTNASQIGVGQGNDLDHDGSTGDVLSMEFVVGASEGSSAFSERVTVNDLVLPMENVKNNATATVKIYQGGVGGTLLATIPYSAADVGDGSIMVSYPGGFDTAVVEATAGSFKIGSFSLEGFVPGDPVDFSVGVLGLDGDGDSSSGTIDITIDPPQAPLETQQSSTAVSSLSQTTEVVTEQEEAEDEPSTTGTITPDDDTLIAVDGEADVFAWTLADAGGNDTVSGFNASEGDSLDLRDLLLGEEAEGTDLTSYLKVSLDGADTVIEVSTDGSFKGNQGDAGKVDQTITLEGVDLVSGQDDMGAIIQSMLDSGKLTIDQ